MVIYMGCEVGTYFTSGDARNDWISSSLAILDWFTFFFGIHSYLTSAGFHCVYVHKLVVGYW